MRSRADEQRRNEWEEVYKRTKRALEPFGTDDEAGGDYFVIDLFPNDKVQMVELHRLHMLRPEIVKLLQSLLVDFPDWQMEILVISPEEDIFITVESGLVIQRDVILDALDRNELPEKYRFVYEGSRRPPGGFNV